MAHTDINTKNPLLSMLPEPWRSYALLMRLDRPAGTWLLLLPGWWAIMLATNIHGGFLFLLFGIGAVVMRGAGCIVNDLWDRDLDSQVERTRTRPLAAGTLPLWEATTLLGTLLLMGLGILLQLHQTAIILGFVSVVFIVIYPVMKRITWWPQAFLGLTFNFGALMGWAAATGAVGLPAILLYTGGIFWTLGYDTIYAHQDKEDDARIGVKSTALRLGAASRRWVIGFYAAAIALIALAVLWAAPGMGGVAGVVALVPAGAHLAWQVRGWNPDDPASCLKFFKSNRDFGLLVLLALAVPGLWTGE